MPIEAETNAQIFYHGTKADLRTGDLIGPRHTSNYGDRDPLPHVYFAATLEAAVWGAELAVGEGRGRIYIVEPTGAFDDDPNLTNKRFPGNPTKSYRSSEPLRIVGEVGEWPGHSEEQLQAMKAGLAQLKQAGADTIES